MTLINDVNTQRVKGLTNDFITAALNHHCASTFRGVYSANTIPSHLSTIPRFSIVCNLDRNDGPGTHFICIIAFPLYVLYIDPFARPCYKQNICNFLKICGKKREIFFNNQQMQSVFSFSCGFYSIMFILYFHGKHTFKLNLSKTNYAKNDEIILENIRKMT